MVAAPVERRYAAAPVQHHYTSPAALVAQRYAGPAAPAWQGNQAPIPVQLAPVVVVSAASH